MKSDEPGFRGATPTGNLDQRSGTASGSNPSRTPPDSVTGGPLIGGDPSGVLIDLTEHGQSTSTTTPGENDPSAITPVPAESLTSTGAGDGHNLADQRRYDWQQKPGG